MTKRMERLEKENELIIPAGVQKLILDVHEMQDRDCRLSQMGKCFKTDCLGCKRGLK